MKDIKQITEQLESGVKCVFDSARYQQYLAFMGKFHHYSINNSILIWLQNPDATLVAGYKAWGEKFNRQVRKGEKGITILAPCPHKHVKQIVDADGNVEEREISYVTYRPCTVFDISQTDGEDVPSICNELIGDIENFDNLYDKLIMISPVPVEYEDITDGAFGYYSHDLNAIRIKSGMSQMQTLKTLIHEIAHAILHSRDNGEEKGANRVAREVQAESVAYTVCTMMGLDTSGYSFEYVAGWSTGRDVKELVASIEVIRKTAQRIYDGLTSC